MAQFLDLTGLTRYKNKSDALYAKQDGSYEGMTVGNAAQLVSTVGVEDSAPYTSQTTGGSADVGDRMNLKAVVGGTITWNQYCDYNETTPTANWSLVNSTLSISGRKMTITSASNSTTRKGVTLKNFLSTANHKYLVRGYITPDSSNNAVYGFYNAGVAVARKIVPYADGKTDISTIFATSASGYDFEILTANATPSGSSCVAEDVMLIDLTADFGSTIADYIYSLEQSNAGAGIAWLKKYGFFTKPYYPHAAANLQSVKTSAHKTYGFNAYNPSTGKAKVVGGMVYQITGAYTALSLDGTSITPDANGYFTPSADGELTVTGGNGTTTCIHLKWDGERDGEWEEYSEHTYSLDDVELRGIPKLDASNNLYYDGDTYEADGTVTRMYGIVDLGTLSWSYSAASGTQLQRFNSSGIASLVKKEGTVFLGIVCPKYIAVSNPVYTRTVDKAMCILSSNGMLYIVDSAYTSAADFKTAMNGVYLVYELATPTTESADPYTNPQIVDDWGTEEYVDYGYYQGTRDVEVPVGHATLYSANLRAKLEMQPNSPDGDGLYAVRQSGGINTYEEIIFPTELPSAPTSDGTYRLVCTVADGVATYSWTAN